MRRTTKLLFALFMVAALTGCGGPKPSTADEAVEIDAEHFPDEHFRSHLLAQPYGEDGVLTAEEIKAVTYMDIAAKGIADLTGIKHFTALMTLDCRRNERLEAVDVAGCEALQYVNCAECRVTTIDVRGCAQLRYLDCGENRLAELNVAGCTRLNALVCPGNQLTRLDVGGCEALETMDCSRNRLTELDVSGCKALALLYCNDNRLTRIDTTGCTQLKRLECEAEGTTSNQRNEI